ncbi:pyridoxamine 5'-phosphate oxidase family protein [Salicibibacter cibarius]|uniref:pyridoxamine 5'-phosphate oxidase family protein n=1 Tax=Salicibibacter cibarius TaxID=2743000 RepID=UPI001FE46EA5|nr:pyridoxamine 5'-phosphate oxidase family protein [Salicibibacter cibarius]
MSEEGPRDSPVWFHWESAFLWIIGTPDDSFPKRIEINPKCAVGIVDFDQKSRKVFHAGFRGQGFVEDFDSGIANRLLSRYLGTDDPRLNNSNVLIRFMMETVVVRDQSYLIRGDY